MSRSSTSHPQTLDFILRSGLAGGIAGCVAKTVVAPLDRVKILFQASNPDFQKYAGTWSGAFRAGSEIYRTAGTRGLFQGHSATLLRVFPYAAVKFMAYDQTRHLLMPTRESETNFRRFWAGALSGMISVFFTYPLELVRVRMAFQTRSPNTSSSTIKPIARPSFLHACAQVYYESTEAILPPASSSASSQPMSHHSSHPPIPATSVTCSHPLAQHQHQQPKTLSPFTRYPILKFYRGFFVTMVGMIPYAGISFLSWESLRARFLPQRNGKAPPTPLPDLAIGALSGVLAQTASYPFEVVRRRMQVGGLTSPDRWLRMGECVGGIWAGGVRAYEKAHPDPGPAGSRGMKSAWGARAAGFRAFYVGLGVGYLKMVPMTAMSFAVWQGAKRVLEI